MLTSIMDLVMSSPKPPHSPLQQSSYHSRFIQVAEWCIIFSQAQCRRPPKKRPRPATLLSAFHFFHYLFKCRLPGAPPNIHIPRALAPPLSFRFLSFPPLFLLPPPSPPVPLSMSATLRIVSPSSGGGRGSSSFFFGSSHSIIVMCMSG